MKRAWAQEKTSLCRGKSCPSRVSRGGKWHIVPKGGTFHLLFLSSAVDPPALASFRAVKEITKSGMATPRGNLVTSRQTDPMSQIVISSLSRNLYRIIKSRHPAPPARSILSRGGTRSVSDEAEISTSFLALIICLWFISPLKKQNSVQEFFFIYFTSSSSDTSYRCASLIKFCKVGTVSPFS